MNEINIFTGVSLGPGVCAVLAGLSNDPSADAPQTAIVQWSSAEGFRGFTVNRALTRMEALGDEVGTLICTTPMGVLCVVANDDFQEETIGVKNGPDTYGYLCALRMIGGDVYAAGMGRQVYRREGSGRWMRLDEQILDDSEDILQVYGFNAIDGTSHDDIWVAGYHGEIWHWLAGAWQSIASPTNVLISALRCCGEMVWACGKSGVLLKGNGNQWRIVEQEFEDGDILSMEYFNRKIFVLGSSGLARVNPNDELVPVDDDILQSKRYQKLHAGRSALWAFGSKWMAWTEDGDSWHEQLFELRV